MVSTKKKPTKVVMQTTQVAKKRKVAHCSTKYAMKFCERQGVYTELVLTCQWSYMWPKRVSLPNNNCTVSSKCTYAGPFTLASHNDSHNYTYRHRITVTGKDMQ